MNRMKLRYSADVRTIKECNNGIKDSSGQDGQHVSSDGD